MDSSEREGDDIIGMESRDVDTTRVASSTSGSSGTRTRSGSDNSRGSGESVDSSSRRDCSDTTSIEDEEDNNSAGDSHAGEAKIADVNFDDGHNSHRDDVGRLIIDGDQEDEEGTGTGAGANARISQMRHNAAGKVDHATEIAAIRQASHLIRSVEVDAICPWDGVGRDQTVTDVRIVMVVDSKPDTRLVLLDLDEKFMKTGSFYSIQKLPPMMTGTVPIGEEISVTPRQDSRSTDASGRTTHNTRFEKENNHVGGYPQRRQSNGEEIGRINHGGDDGLPKFNKRRLFPISRSAASKYPVAEIDHEVDHASSEPTILNTRGWPGALAGAERSLWKSREWIEKPGSLGKESRSTSGHTVQIHSRRTSSSCSSAPPESISPRTAGQLSSTRGLVNQTASHRHCEACKLGGQRLSSGSSPGLQTAVEGSNMKVDSGDKSDQIAHQTCCQPYEQNRSLANGLTVQLEKQHGSVTKIHEPGRDKTDGRMDTCKVRSKGPGRTKDVPCDMALLGLNEKKSEWVPMVAPSDEVPTLAGHGSSSGAQNSSLGSMEGERFKNTGQSHRRISSFSRAIQDKINGQVNLRNPNPLRIRVQNQIQMSNSSLSTDISPKIQVRRERASSAYSPFHHVSHESNPIPIKNDGKLEIYFAGDIASGTYLIEIEASVSLSVPDPSGWRGFLIPGLPPLQHIEAPVLISFRVQSILAPSPLESGKSPSVENPGCSWIAEAQFNSDCLFDVGISTPTQISGKLRLNSSLVLQLRLKIPVYNMNYWDISTSLRTFPRWSEGRGLQIQHHASLTIVGSAQDIFAEQVKYSFLIKNGFSDAIEHTINLGECLIELGNIDWQDASTEHHTEVTVIRYLEDLGKPLEISFAMSYPKKDQLTIRLPTLSPKTGNVISERVMLFKPLSPLLFEYPESDSFSTWRRLDRPDEQPQGACFDRQDLPRFFPAGLKDDLVVRIIELAPVCFRALQCEGNPLISEKPSNLVWNLEINIDKVFGGGLECLMKFDIQAGSSDQVLTVSPHDWTPDLFVTGGRLATQAVGEWRKDRNGNLTLFKLPEMTVGQTIEIALRWYKIIVREKLRSDEPEQSAIEYSLPKIIGKSILGGSLRCNVDSAIHISRSGKSRDAPWQFSNNSFEKQIRVPKLYLGYTIGLSLAGLPYQPARVIRFKDEQPKPACTDPNKDENRESRFENQAAPDQLTPDNTLHPDRHTSSTLNPRSREKALSWAKYSYSLILRLLRCAFTPFLLICAFQFAMSRIMHAWRPVDVMGSSSVKARHSSVSGLRSILNLGSLAIPWPRPESEDQTGLSVGVSETEELLSSSMTEHPLGLGKVDGAENETTIESSEDPGHGEPTAEGMGVMDWIDRALGWKNITH